MEDFSFFFFNASKRTEKKKDKKQKQERQMDREKNVTTKIWNIMRVLLPYKICSFCQKGSLNHAKIVSSVH